MDERFDRIEDCISFLSGKAAQSISRFSRERLAEWDLTPIQFAVLQALLQKPGQNASELGGFLVIDSATTTGVIDRLCKAGLLARAPDPDDRRVNRINLTSEGEQKIRAVQVVMQAINTEVADAFGEDAEKLWNLLRRLAAFRPAPSARA